MAFYTAGTGSMFVIMAFYTAGTGSMFIIMAFYTAGTGSVFVIMVFYAAIRFSHFTKSGEHDEASAALPVQDEIGGE